MSEAERGCTDVRITVLSVDSPPSRPKTPKLANVPLPGEPSSGLEFVFWSEAQVRAGGGRGPRTPPPAALAAPSVLVRQRAQQQGPARSPSDPVPAAVWSQCVSDLVAEVAVGRRPASLVPLAIKPVSPYLPSCGDRVRFGCQLLFVSLGLHDLYTRDVKDPADRATARIKLLRDTQEMASSQDMWNYVRKFDIGRLAQQPAAAAARVVQSLWPLCDVPEAAAGPAEAGGPARLVWQLRHRLVPRKAAQFLFEAAIARQDHPLMAQALSLFVRHLHAGQADGQLDSDCLVVRGLLESNWSQVAAAKLTYCPLPGSVVTRALCAERMLRSSKSPWSTSTLWRHLLGRDDAASLAPAVARRYLRDLADTGRIISPALVPAYVTALSRQQTLRAEDFLFDRAMVALQRQAVTTLPAEERVIYGPSEGAGRAQEMVRYACFGILQELLLTEQPASNLQAVYQLTEFALLHYSPHAVAGFVAQAPAAWWRHPWLERAMLAALATGAPSEAACRTLAEVYGRLGRAPLRKDLLPVIEAAIIFELPGVGWGGPAGVALELQPGLEGDEPPPPALERMLLSLLDVAAADRSQADSLFVPPVAVPSPITAKWRLARR